MKFGRVPVRDAEGALLAHSIRLGKAVFRKGRVLSAGDVAALAEAGVAEVMAARFEAGDMGEDEAAAAVAAAVAGPGLEVAAPFTGRVNLFAEARGVLTVEAGRLDALNLMDESVTVATLAPWSPVERRQMVATVKIIPFAAPREIVARVEGPLLALHPVRPKRIAFIQTELASVKASVLDKTVEITRRRIEALDGVLLGERRSAHEEGALARTIADALEERPDALLIAGASAIVDRRDVLPAAIEAAGGEVEHFGMPVDPGNLLLFGRIGSTPAIGMPGCARSPKLNGFDWVLQRLAAGLPIGRREIMSMGVGGLLVDIPGRPQPRQRARATAAAEPARLPRIAALVLAAGQSRRMGPANKLLAEVGGQAMLERAVAAARASQAASVLVVTGHERARIEAAVEAPTVHNPDYAEGLSTSLGVGIAALPEDVDGAVVLLGDMPFVSAAHIDRLIAAFNPLEGRTICVPTFNGKRGNPVLWGRELFAEMRGVSGDVGAKHLIGANGDLLVEVPMPDAGVLRDIDTPASLTEARSG